MSVKDSKYYVEHNVTPGDVARVHSRVHLPKEIVSRFTKFKKSAKVAAKKTNKASPKRGHSKKYK